MDIGVGWVVLRRASAPTSCHPRRCGPSQITAAPPLLASANPRRRCTVLVPSSPMCRRCDFEKRIRFSVWINRF
ncbi:hypothetical protein E2542_SST03728 [Spatholobus suberectus]|nr:hypothetical protein E2542_SST03728 [Spatholobus suberectus]